jgi:pyruvate dehydrogenase (quinone)
MGALNRAEGDPEFIQVRHEEMSAFMAWGHAKFTGQIGGPYAEYARSLGLDGVRVERPDDVGPAWDAALAADRPFVLEASTDPDVPPLPPHVGFHQAKQFVSSVVKGDPDAVGVIRQSFRDLVESYIPRRG